MREIIIFGLSVAFLIAGIISDDQAFALLAVGLTWCKLDDIKQALLDRRSTHD